MPVNTGIALVGLAIQDDAKTPAESPQWVHGLTGGSPFAFERTVETLAVACGYRGNISAHVSEINMNPTVSSLGYQEVLPVYAYGALGKIESGPGPKAGLFQHVITIGETLPSLTIFGQEGQTEAKGFGKTVSCKVNELELTFSDTEPLTMSPQLMGCNLIRLPENPNLGFPPICYSGHFTPVGGEFCIDTAGQRPVPMVIQSGTWTITNDCEAIRDPTTRRPAYIEEKLSKAAVSFDAVPEDFEEFWKMVTGSRTGTEPASRIVYGSYRATFMHSENPDYILTIEGNRVPFACEVPEVEPEGGTGIFTFSSEDSYVEKVGDSGITITVINDIEDYFDPSTYQLPDNVPDIVGWGEVLPGVDAEQMGDFHISGRSKVISGTATRIAGYPDVEDGYYLPLALDEWEGATVSTIARAVGPVPFEDGVAVVYLGSEGIDVGSVVVTDGAGQSTTYQLDVECSDPLPAVTVAPATGDCLGKDASELGTFTVLPRSLAIRGAAERVTGYKGYSKNPEMQEGYYLPLTLEPWNGTEVRCRRNGEWGDYRALEGDGLAVAFLGKDSIEADAIEVKGLDGETVEYALDVHGVDEVPTVAVTVVTEGTRYDRDVSDFGTFEASYAKRSITGTANHILGYTGFSKDVERQDGFYMCLNLEPWDGTEYRMQKSGSWRDFAPCKGDGDVVFRIGGEDIDTTAVEVKAPDGSVVRYDLTVTPSEEMPPILLKPAEGEFEGKQLSELGTVRVSNRSRAVMGEAKKVDQAWEQFSEDVPSQTGYYLAISLDPSDGAEVRRKKGEEWGEWVGQASEAGEEKGVKVEGSTAVIHLGTESVEVDAIAVKGADAAETEFEVSVTAPAAIARARRTATRARKTS